MKKSYIWLALVLVAGFTFAQEPVKSLEDLKAEQAALQARITAQESKIPQPTIISRYAGVGEELGKAFNGFVRAMDGGLQVTTARVNEFAATPVGKYAMVLIAWKVMGDDVWRILRMCVGIVVLVIWIILLRRFIITMFMGELVVMKIEGPWYNRSVTKERGKPAFRYTSSEVNNETRTAGIAVLIISLVATFGAAMILIGVSV